MTKYQILTCSVNIEDADFRNAIGSDNSDRNIESVLLDFALGDSDPFMEKPVYDSFEQAKEHFVSEVKCFCSDNGFIEFSVKLIMEFEADEDGEFISGANFDSANSDFSDAIRQIKEYVLFIA